MSNAEYQALEDDEEGSRIVEPTTPQEPEDKYSIAWLLFMILGAGILFPWNCFLSAYDYWVYLFGDFPFMFTMSIASSVPNVLFLLLSTKFGPRFSFGSRTLAAFIAHFFVLVAVPVVGTLLPEQLALWIILGCVFVQGCATATLYGSVFGLAALFPPRFIGALMSGNGVAGIITIALRMITKVSLPSNDKGKVESAIIYFGLAAFLILVCIISHFVLSNLAITKFYVEQYQRHNKFANRRKSFQMKRGVASVINSESSESDEVTGLLPPPEHPKTSMMVVFKKVWKEAFNVFMAFFVTLALFPGVTSLVTTNNDLVGNAWFQIFMTGLFMLGDYIGRTLPKWFRIFSPKTLWIPTMMRVVFFPLFILCVNPKMFHNDAFPYSIMFLFSLSNGYCGTLAMMYGPTNADNHEKEVAGTMMSFFLQAGIFVASNFAILLLYIITGSVNL